MLKFAGSWQNWNWGDFDTSEKNREGNFGTFLKKSGTIFLVFCTIHASSKEKISWNQTNNISCPWLPGLKNTPNYRNFHVFLKEPLPTPRRAKLSKYFKISFIRTTNISEEWREDYNLSRDQFLLHWRLNQMNPIRWRSHPPWRSHPYLRCMLKNWNSLKPPSALVRMFWLPVIVFLNCLRPNAAFTSNFIYIWGYFQFKMAIFGAFVYISHYYGSKTRISIWFTAVSKGENSPPTHPEWVDFVWRLQFLKNGRTAGQSTEIGDQWRHM